jgi:hypothetical protein
MNMGSMLNVKPHHIESPTFHHHLVILAFEHWPFITNVAMENISIKLGTPIWFPSSWFLIQTSNISLFGAIDLKKSPS